MTKEQIWKAIEAYTQAVLADGREARYARRDQLDAALDDVLDALERKDNLLREQLTICKYLSRSICMTDETGADTNPDNIVDSSIEAITKELT